MNKKIIVVGIIAVVILVLVSFTGVVGYHTTSSSTIAKESPLFNIRTNRAIDEENKVLTAKYVGKGNILPFPKREDKAMLIWNVIDRLSKMDDETLERFIASFIDSAKKDKRFNDIKPYIIREALNLLKDSDTPIPIFDDDKENKEYTPILPRIKTYDYYTLGPRMSILSCILLLLSLPFFLLVRIINLILGRQHCSDITCKIPCTAMN